MKIVIYINKLKTNANDFSEEIIINTQGRSEKEKTNDNLIIYEWSFHQGSSKKANSCLNSMPTIYKKPHYWRVFGAFIRNITEPFKYTIHTLYTNPFTYKSIN